MIPKRDISSDVVLIRLIDVGCLLLPIFSQKISCDGQSQLLSVHQCCLLHKHLLASSFGFFIRFDMAPGTLRCPATEDFI